MPQYFQVDLILLQFLEILDRLPDPNFEAKCLVLYLAPVPGEPGSPADPDFPD
jgi:hypothetical protein